MPHKTSLLTTVLLTALAIGGPTMAQGVFDMGALTASLSVDHVTQSERARATSQRSPSLGRLVGGSIQQQRQPPTAQSATADSFRFSPSLERRRANIAQIVARQRSTDPAGADKLQATFASTDLIEMMGPPLARYNLRTNNLADAYAVWWISAWQAAHNDRREFTTPTIQIVRSQAAIALASSPVFSVANDATKQELAEILLIQAGMLEASMSAWRDDPVMMRRLGVAVRQGALRSDVDLDTMTLTDRGFMP